MARPNGVVIVSERFWAFATCATGACPRGRCRRAARGSRRIPLVRGPAPARVVDGAARARARGRRVGASACSCSPRSAASFALIALPAPARAAGRALLTALFLGWLFRGRTLRLHGAEHRAIAAAEEGRLEACWSGDARPDPLLPALRHELRRARSADHRARGAALAGRRRLAGGEPPRRGARIRGDDGALEGGAAPLRAAPRAAPAGPRAAAADDPRARARRHSRRARSPSRRFSAASSTRRRPRTAQARAVRTNGAAGSMLAAAFAQRGPAFRVETGRRRRPQARRRA